MKRKLFLALILIGIVLLGAAGGLAVYNVSEDSRAGKESERVLDEVVEAITLNAAEVTPAPAMPQPSFTEVVPEMETVVNEDSTYIGIIEIPSLGVTLPVQADWSYSKLKIAPCRYAGSYYTDDLVICAHNYGSHFNGLRWVDMGEDVYFTTASGVTYHYVIDNRETLDPDENDRLVDPEGDWDLTLFTCYIGGATRCVIRCQRVKNAA